MPKKPAGVVGKVGKMGKALKAGKKLKNAAGRRFRSAVVWLSLAWRRRLWRRLRSATPS